MTKRPPCTCAGTAPGYPQHEDWCGQPEPEHTEDSDYIDALAAVMTPRLLVEVSPASGDTTKEQQR